MDGSHAFVLEPRRLTFSVVRCNCVSNARNLESHCNVSTMLAESDLGWSRKSLISTLPDPVNVQMKMILAWGSVVHMWTKSLPGCPNDVAGLSVANVPKNQPSPHSAATTRPVIIRATDRGGRGMRTASLLSSDDAFGQLV